MRLGSFVSRALRSLFALLQAQADVGFAFKVPLQFRSLEHKLENHLNLTKQPKYFSTQLLNKIYPQGKSQLAY